MEKKTQSAVSRDSDKFMLRFPDGMREKIAEAARTNNRSMNAEIIARMEAASESEAKVNTLVAALKDLIEGYERQEQTGKAFANLVQKVGAYLSVMMPYVKSTDPVSVKFIHHIAEMGGALGDRDISRAIDVVTDMGRFGFEFALSPNDLERLGYRKSNASDEKE